MNSGVGSPSTQIAALARDLHRMGPAMRRRLRADFDRAGQGAASDARSRAGAWSSRIPAAITIKSTTDVTRGRIGVELRVGSANAPHARSYEGLGGSGTFRHPVFGHLDRWVPQGTRPFALPAVQGRAPEIAAAIATTYEAAAREVGFH